jgi:hypothetical protein
MNHGTLIVPLPSFLTFRPDVLTLSFQQDNGKFSGRIGRKRIRPDIGFQPTFKSRAGLSG